MGKGDLVLAVIAVVTMICKNILIVPLPKPSLIFSDMNIFKELPPVPHLVTPSPIGANFIYEWPLARLRVTNTTVFSEQSFQSFKKNPLKDLIKGRDYSSESHYFGL